ncbi:MAG: iron chaperone, partial [Micrococcales bacterium]
AEVTDYFNQQPEPQRSTLIEMRRMLLEVEPNLEQVIAWKSAMFKFKGAYVAGLCAHKKHISFSPQSPEVMIAHSTELAEYVTSKASFQVACDEPLPKSLIASLLKARIAELG